MNVEPSSSDCGRKNRRLQETTAFCDIVDSSDSTFVERVAMISPTDTAYRLLPTSPSARERMGVSAFDREALRIIVKSLCGSVSRTRRSGRHY